MYSGGSGTIFDPYLISNATDLKDIESNMSAYFIQINDIEIGANFSPVGGTNLTTPVVFTGNYDGQGYALKNGTIYNFSINYDYVGIFRKIQNATIKNVYIKNIQIINFSTEGYTGFLVGSDSGNSTITNIHIDILCKLRANNYYAGGIIGLLSAGSLVENCSNNADKMTCYLYSGGIVGYNNGTIRNCYNSSYITTTQWGTGGICGYNTATGVIQYCVNVGLIKYAGSSTGGIVGHIVSGGSCSNCFSLASKLVKGGYRVCSVSTGLNNNYALDTMTSTYTLNDKTLNGKDGADITVPNAMKKINYTNNGFTFTDNSGYWSIDEDTGYAYINQDYSFYQRSIPFSDGEGTETNPYIISTLSDLKNIGDLFYIYESNYYKQINDIEIGDDFVPIGFNTASPYYFYFRGYYDGQGYKLKNGTINKESNNYVGIFAYTSGSIYNLTISNIQVTGKNYVGTIAGYSKSVTYNIKINEYCSVLGMEIIGGVYGYCETKASNTDTNFYQVTNNANVSGSKYVGGMVGYYYTDASNSYDAIIRNCYNTADIYANTSYAGGIVGYAYLDGSLGISASFEIQKCYNSGNIKTVSYGAGICGYATTGSYAHSSTENCFNLCSSITRLSGTSANFFRITNDSSGNSNNYSLNTTMPSGHVYENTLSGRDGLDLLLADAKKQTTYTNNAWDFATVWTIDENLFFPRFKFEPALIAGNKAIFGDIAVKLNITNVNDIYNINFNESKINSNSIETHLTFNGSQRKQLRISGFTDYTGYITLQDANEKNLMGILFIYQPKSKDTINLTENMYFYIHDLKWNFKRGDKTNFYFNMELIYCKNLT